MKPLLLFISIITITQLHAQKNKTLTCKDFREGDFVIIDNESKIKLKIHREKTLQTETPYDLSSGKIIDKTEKLSIKWVNDCTYILLNNKSNLNDIEKEIEAKGGIYVRIKSINGRTAILSSTIGKDGEEIVNSIHKE